MDIMMKTSGDITSFGQDNVQALMRSGQIWMDGCQSIGQSVATSTQAHVETIMSSWKAMSGVKSLKEALDMQKSLMHSSVENFVHNTGTITGAAMALVEESMAPITACMTTAAEKLSIRAN